MPVWKCAVLAFLAIPRCAVAEGDEDPEQKIEELPPDDTDEGLGDSLRPEQLLKMHSKMDVDSNGKVSFNELLEFSHATRKRIAARDIKTVLDEMDSDKDGKLSLVELVKDMDQWGEEDDKDEASKRKAVEGEKFKAADADGDGLLSEVELPALFYPETHDGVLQIAAQSTLGQKDIDKDGLLTAKEFWEGDQVEGEEIAASEEETADFRKLDKDGSGKLDLEELKAWESGGFHTTEALQKFMETADTDHDLHLTSDEMAAAHSTIAGSDAHYHFMEWAEHHEL